MTSIAFIGVGNMGGPMARNLVKAGHDVHAFDLSAAVLEPVIKAGANKADTANACGRRMRMWSSRCCRPDSHVRSVYLESGILASAKKGALLIDSSTIDIDSARAVHAAAKKTGFDFLDAPVSGGVGGAEAGDAHFHVRRQLTPPLIAPNPFSRRWANASCSPAAQARGRRRRSATTCCSPSP